MIHAIRSLIRTQSPAALISNAPHSLPKFGRIAPVLQFRHPTTISNDAQSKLKMEKGQNPKLETGDVMSTSFGEGYATRSDEEGFGGVFSGNQKLPKTEQDQLIHENHPAYDKTQASEVKEKEKGRCPSQSNASTK